MAECKICPHNCFEESRCGKGEFGQISSMAIDPIEKKPLRRFHSGRPIFSIGGFGCNLRCPFCQNHEIAMGKGVGKTLTPEDIVALAKDIPNNIGVAYTYNEPLIHYNFVSKCAKLVRDSGLCNVLITNGYINQKPLQALLPLIDAMNIDLKGFTEEYYAKLGGTLQPVLDTISLASKHCHVEITTLVIPDENESHIEPIAKWLADLNPEIPLHISRFYPCYRYSDKSPTEVGRIYELCSIAEKYLKFVYPGNVH